MLVAELLIRANCILREVYGQEANPATIPRNDGCSAHSVWGVHPSCSSVLQRPVSGYWNTPIWVTEAFLPREVPLPVCIHWTHIPTCASRSSCINEWSFLSQISHPAGSPELYYYWERFFTCQICDLKSVQPDLSVNPVVPSDLVEPSWGTQRMRPGHCA